MATPSLPPMSALGTTPSATVTTVVTAAVAAKKKNVIEPRLLSEMRTEIYNNWCLQPPSLSSRGLQQWKQYRWVNTKTSQPAKSKTLLIQICNRRVLWNGASKGDNKNTLVIEATDEDDRFWSFLQQFITLWLTPVSDRAALKVAPDRARIVTHTPVRTRPGHDRVLRLRYHADKVPPGLVNLRMNDRVDLVLQLDGAGSMNDRQAFPLYTFDCFRKRTHVPTFIAPMIDLTADEYDDLMLIATKVSTNTVACTTITDTTDGDDPFIKLDETTTECIVCDDRKVDTVYLPCKHVGCCATCAAACATTANHECPFCRVCITQVRPLSSMRESQRKTLFFV